MLLHLYFSAAFEDWHQQCSQAGVPFYYSYGQKGGWRLYKQISFVCVTESKLADDVHSMPQHTKDLKKSPLFRLCSKTLGFFSKSD